MNRIDRLTAILIHLQTKRVVKAEEISDRFEISLRTVYRDVKALMEAGVPIGSEAGKGYFIVDGYHLPPVMFNQEEASALLTGGKLVEKMTDASIRKGYESALLKIKAVLNASEKDHLENLQASVAVFRIPDHQPEFPNHFMADIQTAIGKRKIVKISYCSTGKQERTRRDIEPIGVVFYSGHWHVIAWCRLRKGYRDFSMERIESLAICEETFDPRAHYTLQEYFDQLMKGHNEMTKVVVLFDKPVARTTLNARYYYGFVSEEDLGDKCRMTFLVVSLRSFARWIIMSGKAAEPESPPALRDVIDELIDELVSHYNPSPVLK